MLRNQGAMQGQPSSLGACKDVNEVGADSPAISKQIMHIEKATTMMIGNWKTERGTRSDQWPRATQSVVYTFLEKQ